MNLTNPMKPSLHTTAQPIVLDGSTGEGGGQILRTGLALSMVTGRPLHVQHIRAKRPKPGLMRQHLTCVQAATAVCNAQTEGAQLGSTALRFTPGSLRAGAYDFPMAGAGSCMLVLQTILPALMLADAPSTVSLSGGTHNPMAPPFDMIEQSFAPLLHGLGVGLRMDLYRRGFYPAGGGSVHAHITPSPSALTPYNLVERGPLRQGWAQALAPGLSRNIAHRELVALGEQLGWSYENNQLREPTCRQNEGPGNALLATLEYEHFTEVLCQLGERSLSSEQVASRLARDVRAYQACTGVLGAHAADQWMLPLALAVCSSGQAAQYTATEASEHTLTNAAVVQQGLPVRIRITPRQPRKAVLIEIAPLDS